MDCYTVVVLVLYKNQIPCVDLISMCLGVVLKYSRCTTMTQHQNILGWGSHIGSHPNVSWYCTIVVHKESKDHSPKCISFLC